MSNFNGNELLFLLKRDSEEKFYTFSRYDMPYLKFLKTIWLKTLTSQWFYNGYLEGALCLKSYQNICDDIAQYECMKHHLCIHKELGLF